MPFKRTTAVKHTLENNLYRGYVWYAWNRLLHTWAYRRHVNEQHRLTALVSLQKSAIHI